MKRNDGYALVVALSLVAVMAIILATYSIVTVNNTRTSASSGNASAGFYAAEAALNARAEKVRQKFKGFQVPSGATPSADKPCQGGNQGSDDFVCENITMGGRSVTSYVKADAPQNIVIPQGEDFEYLSAQETPFTVYGQAVGSSGNPEAIANLVFRSRLVPLFQFAVFFDKDLEFTNTATLNLSGPVHTNGNLFLDAGSGASLTIRGQTTSAGNIYRGWKHANNCYSGTIQIANDAGTLQNMGACGSTRSQLTAAQMQAFGNQLKTLPPLEVPEVAQLQPSSAGEYWQKADVRIVLKRTGGTSSSPSSSWEPRFVRANGSQIVGVNCNSALSTSQTFRDNREAQYWEATGSSGGNTPDRAKRRTLDVNVRGLLACLQNNRMTLGLGADGIAEDTESGLVLYFTVDDSSSAGVLSNVLLGSSGGGISQGEGANNYAVRLTNGDLLRSTNSTHPTPKGITFVTDEAAIVQGDFNAPATRAAGWIPSSILSDSVNVLSDDWDQNTYCLYRPNNTTFYMSRLEVRRRNNQLITRGDVTASQWNGSTVLSSGTVSAMGDTWYEYTTNNYGASIGESFQGDAKSEMPLWCRNARATTIRTAILAGTATTGDEGVLYPPGAPAQSGGVHNMMRFHENWGSNGDHPNGTVDYTYQGSLVSLSQPLHAKGDFKLGEQRFYQPPRRQWGFEEQFRDAANLPPLTPRFVYLKQDNFTRQFEQP